MENRKAPYLDILQYLLTSLRSVARRLKILWKSQESNYTGVTVLKKLQAIPESLVFCSHPRCSIIKKADLKNFAIFTAIQLRRNLFLIKLQCFPVNIAKFLRTPILKNICERFPLLLNPFHATGHLETRFSDIFWRYKKRLMAYNRSMANWLKHKLYITLKNI